MRHLRVAMLTLITLAAADSARGEDDVDPEPAGGAKAALRAIKGRWVAVKVTGGGREREAPAGLTYDFDGEKLTRSGLRGNGDTVYKVKVEAGKKPWRITLTPEDGRAPQAGIFKIEKGELLLVLVRGNGDKPPEDFTGARNSVMVLTREKK